MFSYWAMMLGLIGMYTMYIIQAGFSKGEISITVTLFTLSSMLGQNVMGYLADRFRCVKKIIVLSIGSGAVAAAALVLSGQHWYIIMLICLMSFLLYGILPLSEAWLIGILKNNGDQWKFGTIRGLGSIGYALSGILLGLLLQNLGWKIYYIYIVAAACIVIVATLVIKENKEIAVSKGSSKGFSRNVSIKEAFSQIIKIKPLRSYVIILFMYNFVTKGIYSYIGILVSDSGGGPLSLGFTYFFDSTPEVVTFFLATRLLSRYQSKELLLAAFILQIARLSLILVFKTPLAIMLLGILSGLAYGLFTSAYKTYIYEMAPENYKISCLSLSESILILAGIASAPVFGFIIMKFNGYASIALGLIIHIAAALILAFSLYKKKQNI